MLILDTDHISLLDRADSIQGVRLRDRLAEVPADEQASTIISFEEQTRGWLAYMSGARTMAAQIEGYRRLKRHLDNYRKIRVLEFDERAAVEFQRLQQLRIRIGTMDLKIAAIVLSHNATLLTRNLVDFRRVPGLRVADWAS